MSGKIMININKMQYSSKIKNKLLIVYKLNCAKKLTYANILLSFNTPKEISILKLSILKDRKYVLYCNTFTNINLGPINSSTELYIILEVFNRLKEFQYDSIADISIIALTPFKYMESYKYKTYYFNKLYKLEKKQINTIQSDFNMDINNIESHFEKDSLDSIDSANEKQILPTVQETIDSSNVLDLHQPNNLIDNYILCTLSPSESIINYLGVIVYTLIISNKNENKIDEVTIQINAPNNTDYIENSFSINNNANYTFIDNIVIIDYIEASQSISLKYSVIANKISNDGNIFNKIPVSYLYFNKKFEINSNVSITKLESSTLKKQLNITNISDDELFITNTIWNMGNIAAFNCICAEIVPKELEYITDSLIINEVYVKNSALDNINLGTLYPLQQKTISYKVKNQQNLSIDYIESKLIYEIYDIKKDDYTYININL